MKNGHLTDEMIQEFIWDAESLDLSARAHMLTCDHCKTRVENYQLLFTEIEQLPKPAFNFDLSSLVLNQIMEQKLNAVINTDLVPTSVAANKNVKSAKPRNIWTGVIITLMATGLI